MNLESPEELIERFNKRYSKETIESKAKILGLKFARTFRIFNAGLELKAHEYVKITNHLAEKDAIDKKQIEGKLLKGDGFEDFADKHLREVTTTTYFLCHSAFESGVEFANNN